MSGYADMTYCELARAGAEQILEMRNLGEPLDEMLRNFKQDNLRPVILRAYSLPRGLGVPSDFADDEMVRCEKGVKVAGK